MISYKVNFESLSWESPMKGVRFKSYEHAGRRLRLVEFSKEFVEPDWCANGHIGYILEGKLEIDFDGKRIVYKPGDGLFIPKGQQHKHIGKVLTDFVSLVLIEDVEPVK